MVFLSLAKLLTSVAASRRLYLIERQLPVQVRFRTTKRKESLCEQFLFGWLSEFSDQALNFFFVRRIRLKLEVLF
jgi:hypothetical protein